MADDLEQDAGAQGAVEQPEPTEPTAETSQGEQPPWGDDFDAQRAWSTIQNLRGREKELEQAAKEYERLTSDPTAYVDFGTQRGYIDIAPDDQPAVDEFADPQELVAARLEALEQRFQQQGQEAQQAQQIAQIEQHVETQLTALDGLDESDREWIVNTAVAMPPTADGMPDIKGAHEKFTAWETARQQKWAKSKRAPHIGQVGTAGTQALPEDAGHNERVAYAMERLQADQ